MGTPQNGNKTPDESLQPPNQAATAMEDRDLDGHQHCDLEAAQQDWAETYTSLLLQDTSASEPPAQVIFTAHEYMERPPIEYLDADKMIPEKSIIMIVGKPGTGKSLFVLFILAELADTMPVMLVAGEARGGIPDRLRALEKTRAINLNFHISEQEVDLRKRLSVEDFIAQIKTQDLDLKVIAFDTYAAFTVGIEENSTKDNGPVLQNIELIKRELGCTVFLVHHTTKDGRNFRGSTSIEAKLDALYHLTLNDNRLRLCCRKSREGERFAPKYYRLVSFVTRQHPKTAEDITSAAVMPDDKDTRTNSDELTDNEMKVLKALDGHEHGLTFSELLGTSGLARSSMNAARQDLIGRGYIVQPESRGHYILAQEGKEVLRKRD